MEYHSKDVRILIEALSYTARVAENPNTRARALTALQVFAKKVAPYCGHHFVGKICFFCGAKKVD